MDKVIEFIDRNKYILIIGLIIVLIFWVYIMPTINEPCGNDEQNDDSFEDYLDKNINFRYDSDKGPLYLALSQAENCSNKQKSPFECLNLAVLQSLKNNFSTFKLSKTSDGTQRYRLRNMTSELTPPYPYLSRNMISLNRLKVACFDGNSKISEHNAFNLVKTNAGVLIKFKIPIQDASKEGPYYDEYFLSECPEGSECEQGSVNLKRVCFDSNQSNAITFNIEVNDTSDDDTETFDSISQMSKISNDIYSLAGLSSLSSGGTFDSLGTSVDGAAENFGSGFMDSYYPWK